MAVSVAMVFIMMRMIPISMFVFVVMLVTIEQWRSFGGVDIGVWRGREINGLTRAGCRL